MDAEELLKRLAAGERGFRQITLVGTRLPGAALRLLNLSRAQLNGVNLHGADLTRIDFSEARLVQVKLAGAHLFMANFFKATLAGIDLSALRNWIPSCPCGMNRGSEEVLEATSMAPPTA